MNSGNLTGNKLLVVGYGDIGSTMGKKAKYGFEMEVFAIKKTISEKIKQEHPEVDRFYVMEDLKEACLKADVVFVSLPFTNETNKVFNEDVFRAMQSHAVFVNVGRGVTVDNDALVKALREGWIAFAGLDVIAGEPLKEDSIFYNDEVIKEKILITCHTLGLGEDNLKYKTEIFTKNFEQYKTDGTVVTKLSKELGC